MVIFKRKNKKSLNILQQQLQDAGINISKWGSGGAKTIAYLQKEIDNGESLLVKDESSKLLRKVVGVGANVYYISSTGMKYLLKEARRVFKDGTIKQRDLGTSVSEKMKLGESPKDAIIRGIYEELGINSKLNLSEIETIEEEHISMSYPGLLSHYIKYNFKVFLTDK